MSSEMGPGMVAEMGSEKNRIETTPNLPCMKFIQSFRIAVLFVWAASAVSAQSFDRSVRPAPGPAPEINLATPERFTLDNGLKVFVVSNSKLPTLSVSMVLDYVPPIEGSQAGYMDVTGSLWRTGTKGKTKEQIDEAIDRLGATVSTSSGGFYASSLSRYKSELFEIMSDLLLNNEFRQEELDRIKKQTISGLQTEKDDAGAIAANVRRAMVYGMNHPYGQITTEQSVESIDLDVCRSFFDSYFRPNLAYMAIVGDISRSEAENLVRSAFGSWKSGPIPAQSYATPEPPAETRVVIVDRPAAVQTVINIVHPVSLPPNAPDVIPVSVMNTLLGGGDARLFNNLRETHAYTYGAYSSLSKDPLSSLFNANAQVRTEVTDSAVHEFLYELNRLRDTMPPLKEVDGIRKYLTGTFAIALQNPRTLAQFAIEMERYGLQPDYYRNYLRVLGDVSPMVVQGMARKHIFPNRSYIICVGQRSAIEEKLKRFDAKGSPLIVDLYGRPVDLSKRVLATDMTAQKVIDQYIDAVGGRAAWERVKSMDLSFSAEMQGMKMNMNMKRKSPSMYAMAISVAGMGVVQETRFDGQAALESGMQGSRDLKDSDLEEVRLSAEMLPELSYTRTPYACSLISVEEIDGKLCHMLEITLPGGDRFQEYYDVESGLKIQKVQVGSGAPGAPAASQTTTYGDYKTVDLGIKLPHSMSISMGPQPLGLKLDAAKINPNLLDSDFKPTRK